MCQERYVNVVVLLPFTLLLICYILLFLLYVLTSKYLHI